ncbi:MAG: Hsp33 family molecular chaperone HslO [Methylophilus sp.]
MLRFTFFLTNTRDLSAMDQLHPFLFENTPIRGNIATLQKTYIEALQHQSLPPAIKLALGELMVASALLISTLKMEGALILQLQSKGLLKLLVVECTSDLEIRATAKWSDEIGQQSFIELVQGGHFVITLTPKNSEPYQGIVALEGNSIAEMLEQYMLRSQQIDTTLWLHCDDNSASGMLLQKLPNQTLHDQDSWNRINQLTNTVTHHELSTLTPEAILLRLFNEEDVRLFNGRAITANCSCSREHVANMLEMLGEREIESIIEEQGSIQINCDFCNKLYVFDENEAVALFHPTITHTKH